MRKWLPHSVFAVAGWRAVGGGRVPVFDVEHWCSLAHGETAPGRPRANACNASANIAESVVTGVLRTYTGRESSWQAPRRRTWPYARRGACLPRGRDDHPGLLAV